MAKKRTQTQPIQSTPVRKSWFGSEYRGDSELRDRGPWGMQLDLPRPTKYYILMPRSNEGDNPRTTFSPAAVARQASHGVTLALRSPQKPVKPILESLQMEDLHQTRLNMSMTTRRGIFAPLTSLGVTAAMFADETVLHDAQSELEDQYEFIPDFDLSLPCRVMHHGSQVAKGQQPPDRFAELPDISGVKAGHQRGIRGGGVLIGMLDTGIDADHAEFINRFVNFRHVSLFPNSPSSPPRDVRGFDTDGHGTHCCGIVAGQHIGIAPEAQLYVASVIESERISTSLARVLAGLNWLLRQFTRPDNEHLPGVLSMSLGFPGAIDSFTGETLSSIEYQRRLQVMRTMLRTLIQANTLPIVAIGNEGWGKFGYPGAFEDVLGIGAVDYQGKLASFSGGGMVDHGVSKPDVVGFGVEVLSSIERDYAGRSIYQRLSGTSMATPYVAGIAALYRCLHPAFTVSDVMDKILTTCDPSFANPQPRGGAGLARFVLS